MQGVSLALAPRPHLSSTASSPKLASFRGSVLVAAGHGASASACCDAVRFDSTGLLAESENRAIISTYEYVPGEGYYRSRQNGLALYYYPSREVRNLMYTLETAYKVAFCPRGNLPYKQICFITNQKTH